MSKIICEICGTTYQNNVAACPICGWTHNVPEEAPAEGTTIPQEELDLDGLREEYLETPGTVTAVQSAPAPAEKRNRAIFDFDADQEQIRRQRASAAVEEDDESYYDGEEEEEGSHNTLLVILLVVLIVLLLVATGFVFFKFFLPGRAAKTEETLPAVTAEIVEKESTEAELPTIPCQSLALPSGIEVLKAEGQNFLLNVIVLPADTTDGLTYASEDESIAIVNDEGRITAVSEGETNIVVTCGSQSIKCPVKIAYEEETEPEENDSLTATVSKGESVDDADDEEEEEATEETQKIAESEIVLKLKKDDIQFLRWGVYWTLELDCDLQPEDVTWESNNKYVADVDATGRVTALGPGIANIKVTYGDQSVICIVRCHF